VEPDDREDDRDHAHDHDAEATPRPRPGSAGGMTLLGPGGATRRLDGGTATGCRSGTGGADGRAGPGLRCDERRATR
jgi:hypothetical protein